MCLELNIPLRDAEQYRQPDQTLDIRHLLEDGQQRALEKLAHLRNTMQQRISAVHGYLFPGNRKAASGHFDLPVPVKQAVHLPVLLTGGVTTPAQAQALLEEGCADLIGMGRAIFKNPHWADSL